MGAHQSDSLGNLIKSGVDANTDEVNRICYPLFKNTPVKYFDYTRYYDTGEIVSCATSSPEFLKQYYVNDLYPSFEEFTIFSSFGLSVAMLSHTMPLPPGASEINPNRYNGNILTAADSAIFHRLYVIVRHPDYYVTSGFGVIREDKSIFNFYLNATPILENFVKYFEHRAYEMIERTCKDSRIIMPYYLEKRVRNDEKFGALFNISKLNFDINPSKPIIFDKMIITPREHECLELIAHGYTMKNAAKRLEISHRTVEQHLRNIKEKLGVSTKNQLVEVWHEYSEAQND